eukprot:845818_1
MAGGTHLKSVVISKETQKSLKATESLLKTLTKSNLVLPLFVMIGQTISSVVRKTDIPDPIYLKYLGGQYDNLQKVFILLQEFVQWNMDVEPYIALLLSPHELCKKYHLQPAHAFHVVRPVIHHPKFIRKCFADLVVTTSEDKSQDDADSKEQSSPSEMSSEFVMNKLMASCKLMIPERTWTVLTPHLYASFWSLSLYDIMVPASLYDETVGNLRREASQLGNTIGSLRKSSREYSDKKRALRRVTQVITDVNADHAEQKKNHVKIREELENTKINFLLPEHRSRESMQKFFHCCILPRCVFSAADAVYCAKFIDLLHSLHTPNFGTLTFCYEMVQPIISMVCSFTSDEAMNYGHFLGKIFSMLHRWFDSEELFNKEVKGTPGAQTYSKQPFGYVRGTTIDPGDHFMDYKEFRIHLHQIHVTFSKLFADTLTRDVKSLMSDGGNEVLNILYILRQVSDVYPAIDSHINFLTKKLDGILKEVTDNVSAIKVAVLSYTGFLKKRKEMVVSEMQFSDYHRLKIKREAAVRPTANKSQTVSPSKYVSAKPNKTAEIVLKSSKPIVNGTRNAASKSTRDTVPKPTRAPKSTRDTVPKSSRDTVSKSSRDAAPKSTRDTAPKSTRDDVPKSARATLPKSTREVPHKHTRDVEPKATRDHSSKSARDTVPKPSRDTVSRSTRESGTLHKSVRDTVHKSARDTLPKSARDTVSKSARDMMHTASMRSSAPSIPAQDATSKRPREIVYKPTRSRASSPGSSPLKSRESGSKSARDAMPTASIRGAAPSIPARDATSKRLREIVSKPTRSRASSPGSSPLKSRESGSKSARDAMPTASIRGAAPSIPARDATSKRLREIVSKPTRSRASSPGSSPLKSRESGSKSTVMRTSAKPSRAIDLTESVKAQKSVRADACHWNGESTRKSDSLSKSQVRPMGPQRPEKAGGVRASTKDKRAPTRTGLSTEEMNKKLLSRLKDLKKEKATQIRNSPPESGQIRPRRESRKAKSASRDRNASRSAAAPTESRNHAESGELKESGRDGPETESRATRSKSERKRKSGESSRSDADHKKRRTTEHSDRLSRKSSKRSRSQSQSHSRRRERTERSDKRQSKRSRH